MRKILLVLEDYQELTTLQSLLMKFGWDVKGVRRDIFVKEEMVAFRPDIILATGFGRQVKGAKMAQALSKTNAGVKTLLILGSAKEVLDVEPSTVSGFFVRPLDPKAVVRTLAGLSDGRLDNIMERYQKIFGEALPEAGAPAGAVSREEVFAKWVEGLAGLPDKPWERRKIHEIEGRIAADRPSEDPRGDEDRKEFVDKLFGKKS